MRKLFGLLNFILCFELAMGTFLPNVSFFTSTAYAQSCSTGFTYDSVLNRCLTKTETANVLNATAACNGDAECYKRNAQEAFEKEVNAGNAPKEAKGTSDFVSGVANIAAVAGPVTVFVAGMGGSGTTSTCTSASFWTMIGGSAALFVGDNLANFQHKKRLKEIKDDWGKIVNPEQAAGDKDKEKEVSMEAQSQAFEMLARSEESLAKAAKMKKNFFMIGALAYAASGVIALLEIATKSTSFGITAIKDICKTTKLHPQQKESLYASYAEGKKPFILDHQFNYNLEKSTDLVSFVVNQQAQRFTNTSPTLDYYQEIKSSFDEDLVKDTELFTMFKEVSLAVLSNLNPIPKAIAQVDSNASKSFKEMEAKGSNPLITAGIGAAAGFAAGKLIGAKLITPESRAIFSGVMAGMTTIMATHAGKQAEASSKRAELLRKMRDEFKSAYGAINNCKSEDRTDPGKPECYCYTPENSKNPNRTNSSVCQKLWAGIDTTSGKYTASNANSKVCINNQNKADATCSCKSNNTCMKVNLQSLKGGVGTGTFSMLSQAVDPVNKVANGSIDAANVDTATMASLAAKLNKATAQLENKKQLADYKKNKKKWTDQAQKSLQKSSQGIPSSSLLGSTSGSNLPSNPGEAARMLETELKDSPVKGISGGQGIAANGTYSGEEEAPFDFNLGESSDPAAAREVQLAEAMNQDLDYGASDINEGANTNIFELLSNRYQRSGMKRLFEDKSAANATEQIKK